MFDGMLKDFGWSLVGSIFSNNIIHNAVGGNVLNLLLEAYILLCTVMPCQLHQSLEYPIIFFCLYCCYDWGVVMMLSKQGRGGRGVLI